MIIPFTLYDLNTGFIVGAGTESEDVLPLREFPSNVGVLPVGLPDNHPSWRVDLETLDFVPRDDVTTASSPGLSAEDLDQLRAIGL